MGPILEKTAFDLMVEGAKPQAETLYARSTLFIDNIYLKPKGPERKVLKEFVGDAVLDRFVFVLSDYVKNKKEIPLYAEEDMRIADFRTGGGISPAIEGPASEREIIFSPEELTVPRGLYDDTEGYVVKLKFFLSNNGIVREIEPVASSGYPEIDLRAIEFLKKWRFSPLSMVEKDKSIWGIVTIKVTAK
ncbi:MAG: energy transducer TonB [Candidatus Omnitrophica bacterium]|nr:energy transducer TonB [Candidatus Omnitrophota bacterium]